MSKYIFNRKCGCVHPNLPITEYLLSKYNASGCLQIPYNNTKRDISKVNSTELDIAAALKNVICYQHLDEEEKSFETEMNCVYRQGVFYGF